MLADHKQTFQTNNGEWCPSFLNETCYDPRQLSRSLCKYGGKVTEFYSNSLQSLEALRARNINKEAESVSDVENHYDFSPITSAAILDCIYKCFPCEFSRQLIVWRWRMNGGWKILLLVPLQFSCITSWASRMTLFPTQVKCTFSFKHAFSTHINSSRGWWLGFFRVLFHFGNQPDKISLLSSFAEGFSVHSCYRNHSVNNGRRFPQIKLHQLTNQPTDQLSLLLQLTQIHKQPIFYRIRNTIKS